MNCTICHRPVVLNPSAKDRAAKYGGTPQDYVRLFPQHADCLVRMRSDQAIEAMRKARDANSSSLCR